MFHRAWEFITRWIHDRNFCSIEFQFQYLDEIQMNFLRLLSNTVQQKITYLCKNSMACDDKKKSINLIGENEIGINMNSPRNYRPKIIQDSKV